MKISGKSARRKAVTERRYRRQEEFIYRCVAHSLHALCRSTLRKSRDFILGDPEMRRNYEYGP